MAKQYDTVYGYDGLGYTVEDRVELHPGTDLWMRGARYGTVVGLRPTPNDRVHVELDKFPGQKFSGAADTFRWIDSPPDVDMFGDAPGALAEMPH